MKFRTVGSRRNSAGRAAAANRVEAWTRGRFSLPQDAVVSVSQVECGLPGCPPVETVVMFWTAERILHRFKVFKPLEEVSAEDLPPAWLREALSRIDDEGGCC